MFSLLTPVVKSQCINKSYKLAYDNNYKNSTSKVNANFVCEVSYISKHYAWCCCTLINDYACVLELKVFNLNSRDIEGGFFAIKTHRKNPNDKQRPLMLLI